MVRRYFGEERILDEALDVLVPAVYREAVEADESIEPIARARLEVATVDPLVVKATIPVRPNVELADYTAIRVAPEPITVDETRVDETLLTLRRRSATLEPVEREVRWRDVLRMDVKATVEERPLVEQEDAEIQLVEERDVLFDGFEEALLGHRKGDTVEFELTVPDGFSDPALAGKPARFTVLLKETKEEVLPEMDDEWTAQLGDGYASVEALRDRIRDDVRSHEEEQRNNRWHDQILGELVERSTIEFPPVMLEAEVDRLLHEHTGQQGHGKDLERALAAVGKTEAQVRAEFQPIAEMRLRRSLALSDVSEKEQIEVADEEVEVEIDRMTAGAGAQAAQLRQLFASDDGRSTVRRNLVTRKTLARLVEIATQDAGGDATAEQEKPRSKRKKSGGPKAAPADETENSEGQTT
jgi:trigger factor